MTTRSAGRREAGRAASVAEEYPLRDKLSDAAAAAASIGMFALVLGAFVAVLALLTAVLGWAWRAL